MNHEIQKIREKALATDYPRWRNVASTIFLGLMCLVMVGSFWYVFASIEGLGCYKGFLYMSMIWIVVELLVIAYMFTSSTIPKFARTSIALVIAFSNIWFGLFIFSLKPCVI